jgi:hypothetical protein
MGMGALLQNGSTLVRRDTTALRRAMARIQSQSERLENQP